MRLRNSAVPGVDLGSVPDIAAEADALARSIGLLSDEVQALSERAARLQQAGHPEAEWLLARFQTHRLASPDLSGPAARILIQATFAALEEHRAGLARDAAELDRVEAAAAEEARAEGARRAEAARKEAEARARRESQAAAERARNSAAARVPAVPVLAEQRASEPAKPVPAARASPRTPAQPLGKISAPGSGASGRNGTRIPVHTQVDLSSDSNVFTGFSTNLSEGGVFVATVNLLPVGTPVDLTLTLPGKTRIAVKGEVRWTREIDDRVPDLFPGVGVRFVELGPEASEALHRFVKEREPLFYPD